MGKRNKIFIQITVCAAIFIFILTIHGKTVQVTNQTDLNKMMAAVEKMNGQLTQWSIFSREELEKNMTTNELVNKEKEWKEKFPQFQWEKQHINNQWQLIGTYYNSKHQYEENLKLTANLYENGIQGFVLYEIKGEKWDSHIANFLNDHQQKMVASISQKHPIIFSCISGEFSDMISLVESNKMDEMIETFNGKIIEKLTEEKFVSITMNSNLFAYELPSENGSFNMQFSLREGQMGEKTSFVIGTPIITVEY
ncbi:YwmB family TATA-box binding protein [Bacillus kwashiorkori]|uniref:YwmB family TATA-box binding protein n=1 Tax=Bacillus kwashiorkori TaxID=1522318 RepID=UPI0007859C6D|nr:YwmB family TATA-box binding protein [Bacillus kwashiorkori]